MSTQYNGDAANLTLPPSVLIASSTNATPIVITTSTAHGLSTGDTVDIQGHATNTNANGVWIVTVPFASTNTFSIAAGGNGVGSNTGTVQSLAVGTPASIPSDGDSQTASSVDVMLERLSDQTALLGTMSGGYKIVDIVEGDYAATPFVVYDFFNITSNSTPTLGNSGNPIWNGTTLGFKGYNQFDKMIVDVDVSLQFGATSTNTAAIALGLYASVFQPGVTPSAHIYVPGSIRSGFVTAVTQTPFTARLSGLITAGADGFPAGNGYQMNIFVKAQALDHTVLSSLAFGNAELFGAGMARVMQLRPTNMPQ